MAKKRRLTIDSNAKNQRPKEENSSEGAFRWADPAKWGLAAIGAAIVYVTYFPSDSIAVEQGDALWFTPIAILIAAAGWARDRPQQLGSRFDWVIGMAIDIGPWLLAGWVMVAAFASSPPGNLRTATNEGWLWVSGAAVFTGARRLLTNPSSQRAILLLLVMVAIGQSVLAVHQNWVSLPATRAEYREDPDRILEMAGIDGPPGSAERMRFENRLLDGGPSGTFALANSLAAVVLVGLLIALGGLWFQWSQVSVASRMVGIAVIGVGVTCLLFAGSRSAIVSMVVGAMLFLVASVLQNRRQRRNIVVGFLAVVSAVVTGVIGVAMFGKGEWFQQAPASLAFRFQYWRSTWKMATDHPWVGAGPGNFRLMYEHYREATAGEQIADPHNFLFETLASGGFVAALLLLVIASAAIIRNTQHRNDEVLGQVTSLDDSTGQMIWWGAGASLLSIWMIGYAIGQLPDPAAQMFAVPIAVGAGLVWWRSFRRLEDQLIPSLAGVAIIAILVNLSVAGGWTVPGVAITVWLLAAIVTVTPQDPLSEETPQSEIQTNQDHPRSFRRRTLVSIGIAGGLLAVLRMISLGPATEAKNALLRAEYHQLRGSTAAAEESLRAAAHADPWASQSVVWLAELDRMRMVASTDDQQTRTRWESSIATAKQRAGEDPTVYRALGSQQIHMYQRFGRRRDLVAAAETFEAAMRWSPANQWLAAQWAVIAEELGDSQGARRAALQALELANSGINTERKLDRQLIFVVNPLGETVRREAERRPATELLLNQLDTDNVGAQTREQTQ